MDTKAVVVTFVYDADDPNSKVVLMDKQVREATFFEKAEFIVPSNQEKDNENG